MTHLRLYETPNLGVHQTSSSSIAIDNLEVALALTRRIVDLCSDGPVKLLLTQNQASLEKALYLAKREMNALQVVLPRRAG